MKLTELATFDVAHEKLSWPWISFDANGRHFAFATRSPDGLRIASRVLDEGVIVEGPSFALPADLALPTVPAVDEGTRDTREGVHGFSLDGSRKLLAVIAVIGEASVLVTLNAAGEVRRSTLEALAGPGIVAHAVTFDRSGTRLWISAESVSETSLFLVDAESHAVVGIVRSPPLPPPAMHELHVHPTEDAVLLLAACGQDGTFARVARLTGGALKPEWTSMEGGSIPAGMVGFAVDGTQVYLAEADELRTHKWPGLKELSSTPFEEDFVSSFSGAIIGGRILVDGEDSESNEDAVAMFDQTASKATFLIPPVPSGMWAGRLGSDVLVTVEAKGEPVRGRVVRITI